MINDDLAEPTESFTATLSHPSSNALLAAPATATITILDQDTTDNSTKTRNISTRGPILTGDEVMIAGFIIVGSQEKSVVLRALGPSLTQLGVADALSDPDLSLFDGNGTLLGFNDDYQSNSLDDQERLENAGLTPTDTRESALLATLLPGNYTAIVRGKTNGVGMVEAYDVGGTAFSRFANISTRGKVEHGDNGAMIAGFILTQPDNQPGIARRVVIRALGPSLSQSHVVGLLSDPLWNSIAVRNASF